MVELISVILACYAIYRLRCHNIEMRIFGQVCSSFAAGASDYMDENAEQQATESLKTCLESISEELYEYVWTTKKVRYRTGADKSYKSAGTLEKDKMVRRTGITYNGWSRIVVDDKEYYIYRSADLYKFFDEEKKLLFVSTHSHELAEQLKKYTLQEA